MNAMLANIADGGRAIVVIYREGSRKKLISPLLYNFILNSLMAASANPFRRGSRGWGTLVHQNHGAGGGNGSIMVGMFVCLYLVSKKPSEQEFFVPARTNLGVKLLKAGSWSMPMVTAYSAVSSGWDSFKSESLSQDNKPSFHWQHICQPTVFRLWYVRPSFRTAV